MREYAIKCPLGMMNLIFFLNVDIFFYLIGIFQKSFWLIDPYWSIIPPVFAVMWKAHPLAVQSTRGDVAMVLTFIWGIRLTYSYFRREEWKFGTREDWRYTKMAIDFGRPLWYFMSFLAVGLAQHPMIVGISLPLYSVRFGPEADKPWNSLDWVATIFCLLGIYIANISDNQLREFMMENERRKLQGQ